MSGGSYDYLCYKVEDAACILSSDKNPTRKAFGIHLHLIAKALHDIEWVDSADMSDGDEIESIMKCITVSDVLKTTIEEAKKIKKELDSLIIKYEKI